jgi:hypothetical protein
MDLSPESFTRQVEALLQAGHAEFERRDLQTFLADEWPHVQDDPDPTGWAEVSLKRERVLRTFREAAARGETVYFHFRGRDGQA